MYRSFEREKMPESTAEALRDLLAGKSSRIELDIAALEIARIEYPDLDANSFLAQLDQYAFEIAGRVDDFSDGANFVAVANEYLFGDLGFRGDDEDYYNPANCCLNRVLETRRGIPITLSVLYIEIARRLAKPVRGVGLPGHFLVRYDDLSYSAIIDPFHGGQIVDAARCCYLAQVESLDDGMLDAVDQRHIAMRLINNLRGIYFNRRDGVKALQILDLLIDALPDRADEHKQRAVALLQQQRIPESFAAFKRYLDLSPDAPDRERVEEQMRNIAFWLSSRN